MTHVVFVLVMRHANVERHAFGVAKSHALKCTTMLSCVGDISLQRKMSMLVVFRGILLD